MGSRERFYLTNNKSNLAKSCQVEIITRYLRVRGEKIRLGMAEFDLI
jgi:hypothetical protein